MNFKDYQNCTDKADKYDRLKSAANKCGWMIDKLQKKGRFYKKIAFFSFEVIAREDEYEGNEPLFTQAELLGLQEILKVKLETLKAEMEEL